MRPILETKQLSYSYDKQRKALEQVSISIQEGAVTAILGGNGAGKSTLFLNLNGVLKPQEGEVWYRGERVRYDAKGISALRKKVGIVFQDPNDQLFSADVISDISFGPMNLGLSESEVRAIVQDVAAQTGVEEFARRPAHALSFGQKKRVAIAGVLAMQPEVIILDEPTAGLDPAGVSEILQLLVELQKTRSLTILLSTHDIDIVPLYCDYAYVLDHGRVALADTAEELFSRAEELRRYSLRLPRIAHLMEILKKEDRLDVDERAATISKARKTVKELVERDE